MAAVAAACCCLAIAIVAGTAAHAQLTRKPTAAERSAAAAAAVAGRWRSWPAGRIFPATLGYGTGLLTREKARRVGIEAAAGCETAMQHGFAVRAVRDGCRAALRATYSGELEGVVYTIGVLAFGGGPAASAFRRSLRPHGSHVIGLRAAAFAGTASARFTDAARQASAARQRGPYVVVVVAGYADGRSAAATGERRASVFAPAAQLAAAVLAPLAAPARVNCGSPAFSC